MVGHIQSTKSPKEAWENLIKIFAANTAARKLQLRQELNNLQQRDMSITSYTLKIKELCDALSSINVIIDDDKMVQICLGGLAPRFGMIRSAILARENPPSFLTFSRYYWWRKIMPDKGAMHMMVKCSTPS